MSEPSTTTDQRRGKWDTHTRRHRSMMVPWELDDAIRRLARESGRSWNAQACRMLEQHPQLMPDQ